jgi:DNA-binding PadR family transcriptional regulator
MDMLTKLEELVLIAVLKLKDQAYGISIYDYVVLKTGNKVAVSSVYFPLERLVRKGYLESFKGEPTPKRGGMRKKYYALTQEGIDVLQENRELNRTIWNDVDGAAPRGAKV